MKVEEQRNNVEGKGKNEKEVKGSRGDDEIGKGEIVGKVGESEETEKED